MKSNNGLISNFRYYAFTYYVGSNYQRNITWAVWDDYTHKYVTTPTNDQKRNELDTFFYNEENRLYVASVSSYVGKPIDITG